MLHWLLASFKRQIVFILFMFTLLTGVIAVSKFYMDEKAELYEILNHQVTQMAHQLSLSLTDDVFYNNYLDVYDNITALVDYNNDVLADEGALFIINYIVVLTPDNKIIGHSNPNQYPIGTPYSEDISQQLLAKPSTTYIQWNEEQSKFQLSSVIHYSSETIGFVLIEITPTFLQSSLNNLLSNILIPVFIFIVGLIVFSFFFAYWIDKPLLEMLNQLGQIGQGKIQLPLTLKRKDEFKTLAQAMVQADERIICQNNELLAIQKDLEQRVEFRTKELMAQTDELTKTLTHLKTYQKKLVEQEKMASLGSLVAGVAHEINTPLGVSITGITHIETENSTILKSIEEEKLSRAKLLKYLNMVTVMANSMHLSLLSAAKLVTSFKQVATDQLDEDKRLFNLKAYSEQVIFSLHSKLRNLPITIENNIDGQLEINTYAGVFSQTITNFIMNSLLHGFDEKTEKGLIIINAWETEGNLTLTYEDNGHGIEEQYLNRIFDPFFSTKMGQGGSGLGLNIIYNLINHQLKGTISCANKTQGIIITIIIPMSELE